MRPPVVRILAGVPVAAVVATAGSNDHSNSSPDIFHSWSPHIPMKSRMRPTAIIAALRIMVRSAILDRVEDLSVRNYFDNSRRQFSKVRLQRYEAFRCICNLCFGMLL